MDIDLSVSWLGLEMTSPLYNASGVMCRSVEDLEAMRTSNSGALITKSCTLEPREGNPEPRYFVTPLGSINSMGLPNYGYQYYLDYAEKYDYANNKPLFISISGMSLADNLTIIKAFHERALPCILEVNLSCPNLPGKPQLGYDLPAAQHALEKICEFYDRPFGVKLPPYFDVSHFDQAAEVFNKFDLLKYVTCINSVGNGLVIDVDAESVVIKPKDGLGGLGGDYVLPTALANVREFVRRLPGKQVVGCGGVKSGREAFMHILAGATAVQVGSCLYEEGVGAFDRIAQELKDLMAAKGYQKLSDFRGKLKTL
ncbi:dihydroorotate oxidase B catalytic subunit [Crenobacter luteus]|uniref:dihydroorotate oxidase n=1 Tax=Crenobacter luteus TaxID=1452487 RepID=UPI001043219E|nr:dihydroorotate oxidase [Crenobacter luteus]TCP10273.1 dihydroorotate oxidase B catalytic subunit [Crenobacter luteus]